MLLHTAIFTKDVISKSTSLFILISDTCVCDTSSTFQHVFLKKIPYIVINTLNVFLFSGYPQTAAAISRNSSHSTSEFSIESPRYKYTNFSTI